MTPIEISTKNLFRSYLTIAHIFSFHFLVSCCKFCINITEQHISSSFIEENWSRDIEFVQLLTQILQKENKWVCKLNYINAAAVLCKCIFHDTTNKTKFYALYFNIRIFRFMEIENNIFKYFWIHQRIYEDNAKSFKLKNKIGLEILKHTFLFRSEL